MRKVGSEESAVSLLMLGVVRLEKSLALGTEDPRLAAVDLVAFAPRQHLLSVAQDTRTIAEVALRHFLFL